MVFISFRLGMNTMQYIMDLCYSVFLYNNCNNIILCNRAFFDSERSECSLYFFPENNFLYQNVAPILTYSINFWQQIEHRSFLI